MFDLLIKFFYPDKCIFCGEKPDPELKSCCRKCYYKMPVLSDERCLICGRELYSSDGYKVCSICRNHKMYMDANYPSFLYDGNIKEALLKFKFAGKMWYHKQLAFFMSETIKKNNVTADFIVYPPVNGKTFNNRGYNHAELLAEEISRYTGIKIIKNAIYKVQDNEKQSLMSAQMRWKNVRNVFAVKEKYNDVFKGKKILLIDDILTVGATISECSRMLKKSGAKSVVSATLCITR